MQYYCVISIPKCGTYLINSVLSSLFDVTYSSRFVFGTAGIAEVDKSLKVNPPVTKHQHQGILTHMYYSNESLSEMLNRGYKIIFIYRHPFDAAVSFVEGAIKRIFHDPMAKYMITKLKKSNEDKYFALLRGVPKIKHPNAVGLKEMYLKRLGWMDSDKIIHIKYADLVGEAFGGSNEGQQEVVKRMSSYLEIPDVQIIEALKNSIGVESKTAKTFRKGTVGQWRNVFTDRLKYEYNRELEEILNLLYPIEE